MSGASNGESSRSAGEEVFLALGSNLGDSVETLLGACRDLKPSLERFRVSSFYRTRPVGEISQPDFLNAVVGGTFAGDLQELFDLCQKIEREHGRDRTREVRWGPRTLDIDIVLFGDSVSESDRLTIPHPRVGERAFVLIPLLELQPEICDPRTGEPFARVLSGLGGAEESGIYFECEPRL